MHFTHRWEHKPHTSDHLELIASESSQAVEVICTYLIAISGPPMKQRPGRSPLGLSVCNMQKKNEKDIVKGIRGMLTSKCSLCQLEEKNAMDDSKEPKPQDFRCPIKNSHSCRKHSYEQQILDLMNADYSENVFFSLRGAIEAFIFQNCDKIFIQQKLFGRMSTSFKGNNLVSINSQQVAFMLSTYHFT